MCVRRSCTPCWSTFCRLVSIAVLLVLWSSVGPALYGQPSVGAPSAIPSAVAVNTPTVVTVIAYVADPSVLPGGVNLLRLQPSSAVPLVLPGVLRDDGQGGDAAPGDRIFTGKFTFNEPSPGQIRLQLSVAFRGLLRRVLSPIFTIDAQTNAAPVVHTSTPSKSGDRYPTGSMVRIDVDQPTSGPKFVSGTIRITSPSQGYDSGLQQLLFGSIFYMWDTTSLNPASDYIVEINLTDANGNTQAYRSLAVTLTTNPPAINKLVSDLDLSFPALGLPVTIVRTYLLNSSYNGPLGYGWTHSYNMHIVEASGIIANLQLVSAPVQVFNADGSASYFTPISGGGYKSPKGDFRTLIKNPDGTFLLKGKFGTLFSFTAAGKLSSIQDRNGNTTTLNYDSSGLLKTITDASGQNTTFAHDGNGRISSITDPAGRPASYAYDATGNLISVTDIADFATAYAYDANHNLTTITDPTGRRTFFMANPDDRLESVSGEGGTDKVTFQYGVPAANQMTVTDALGNDTLLTFDNNASITVFRDSVGRTTTFTYVPNLLPTSITDAAGTLTTFTYDSHGNVLQSTDANGGTQTFAYDAFNQVTSATDQNDNTTRFDYDGGGNLRTITFPNLSVESFTYDLSGTLVTKTDRKNQIITLVHDGRGQLLSKTFPDGTSHTFLYDAAGRLSSAADQSGAIVFTYDRADRVVKVFYPQGDIVAYSYDTAGRRTELTYPDGGSLVYSYDLAGRLKSITRGGTVIATYDYDQLSRPVRRQLQNGIAATFTYDAAGQLIDLLNANSSSEIISSFSYTYDDLGDRVSMRSQEGITAYVYDRIGQLTSVAYPAGTSGVYNYDRVGNRMSAVTAGVSSIYDTNNINQYTMVSGDTLTYDANGSLIARSNSSNTTYYTYDFQNRLVEVNAGTQVLKYTYDPFGRRVSKVTGTATVNYIYSAFQVLVEKDGNQNVQASYVYGVGVDEVLAMERNGRVYFYSTDGLGSVTDLTDITGSRVEHMTYDAYGAPNAQSTVGNSYLFTGREFEPEISLYYYRFRFYDPTIGRFLSADPSGFSEGDLNLYGYAKNNPVNVVDSFGLFLNWKQQAMVDWFRYTVGGICSRAPGPIGWACKAGLLIGGGLDLLSGGLRNATDEWIRNHPEPPPPDYRSTPAPSNPPLDQNGGTSGYGNGGSMLLGIRRSFRRSKTSSRCSRDAVKGVQAI